MTMLSPHEIAERAIAIGKTKANMAAHRLLLLGILAGAYIALAAAGANTAACTIENPSAAKLIGACIFPVGLLMILIGGGELFTGNSLLLIGVLELAIRPSAMLRNWLLVYLGNFIGAVLIALAIAWSGQLGLFGGAAAEAAIATASAKLSLTFGEGLVLGILCNLLVCAAVWMSYGATSVGGKLAAIYLPVLLFVLAGFEHCVANMYYVPAGIFAEALYPGAEPVAWLTWGHFLRRNLLPVTLGNILGGACCIALPYWAVYLRKPKAQEASAKIEG